MKLDTKTTTVLKNFSSINPSLLFREGNTIKTISPTKTIMAKATVNTKFDRRFAIYNLSKFLGTLSFYSDPEVVFNDKNLIITDGNGSSTTLSYADENTIKVAPEKEVALPSIDASFKITNASLQNIMKMLGNLGVPEVAIIGDGTNLTVAALDSKNPGSETHSEKVGTTDKVFRAIFKAENLKLLPGDYNVDVSSKGISHFKGDGVEYWVAVEQNSTF